MLRIDVPDEQLDRLARREADVGVAVDDAQPVQFGPHGLAADLRQRVVDRVVLIERSDDAAEASRRVHAIRDDNQKDVEVVAATSHRVLPGHPMIAARRRRQLLQQLPLDLHERAQRDEALAPLQELAGGAIRIEQQRHLLLARDARKVVRLEQGGNAVAGKEVGELLAPHQADERYARLRKLLRLLSEEITRCAHPGAVPVRHVVYAHVH
jgi:hypothetical protein